VAKTHILNVPDALIAWGKEHSRKMARPWAFELERLVEDAQKRPLDDVQTEMLLNRVDALSIEATKAGRGDLLLELDMLTAEEVGVVYEFDRGEHQVPLSFGKGQRYEYDELRVVLSASDPAGAAEASESVKDLLSAHFPQARISAIVAAEATVCMSCGATEVVGMVEMESGGIYCGSCYTQMTDLTPVAELIQRGRK